MKLSVATATLLFTQRVATSEVAPSASSFLREVAPVGDHDASNNAAKTTRSDAQRRKLQRLQNLQQKHQQLHRNEKVPAFSSGLLKNQVKTKKGHATKGGTHIGSAAVRSSDQAGLASRIACNPDADVGLLLATCNDGEDSQHPYRCVANQASPLGGYCTPQQGRVVAARSRLRNRISASTKANHVECDPDVGVLLACPITAVGQQQPLCVRNPQSSLGGFCQHSKTKKKEQDSSSVLNQHRRHAEEDYGYTITLEDIDGRLCREGVDGDDDYLQSYYGDCDCTGFDRDTGDGVIACTYDEGDFCFESSSCPVDGCLSTSYEITFEGFRYQSFEYCNEVNLNGDLQIGCLSYSLLGYSGESCSASFNGESCDCTYDYFPEFNCSAVGGGAGYNAIEIVPGLSYECLYDRYEYTDDYYGQSRCFLYCGGRYDQSILNDKVVDVPWNRTATNGTATCSELYGSAIRAPDHCDALQTTFNDECCVPRCSICPPQYRSNNYASTTIPGLGEISCDKLQYDGFDNATCGLIEASAESAAEDCCVYRCYNVCGDGYEIKWGTSEADSVIIPDFGNVSCSEVLPYFGGELHYEVFNTQESCSALRPVMQESSCCYFRCYNVCGEGYEINWDVTDADSVVLPGFGNVSCSEVLPYFGGDLHYEVFSTQETCSALSPVMRSSSCCQPQPYVCSLCEPGSHLSDYFWNDDGNSSILELPDLDGSFTCRDLYFDAMFDGAVPEGQCDDIRAITHPVCCSSYHFDDDDDAMVFDSGTSDGGGAEITPSPTMAPTDLPPPPPTLVIAVEPIADGDDGKKRSKVDSSQAPLSGSVKKSGKMRHV